MTVTMTTWHRQYQQAILAVAVAVVGMSVVLVVVAYRHFDEQVSEEDPHNIRHPFYLNILYCGATVFTVVVVLCVCYVMLVRFDLIDSKTFFIIIRQHGRTDNELKKGYVGRNKNRIVQKRLCE